MGWGSRKVLRTQSDVEREGRKVGRSGAYMEAGPSQSVLAGKQTPLDGNSGRRATNYSAIVWLSNLASDGRRAAHYSVSGESDYREASCLAQPAPARMGILKASLHAVGKDCTPSRPADPQVGNARVPSQVD